MSFVSYAQNFEDVLLNRVFGSKPFGFYVDVGACHPVAGSVTKALYDRGWSGINVEPGRIFDVLALARPRDVNLQIAVLDRTGEASFLESDADPGMSKVIDRLESQIPGTVRTVACDTLSNIVAAHGQGRPVDFVKIDAEGSEAAIVGATDWGALRPTLLVVDSTLPRTNQLANQHWEPALLARGYRRVYFDGINCFYTPEERTDVAAQLATPVNVLDDFVIFDPEREKLEVRVRKTEADRDALRHQAAVLDRLVRQLRWPDGPRALRVTLPVARLVRRLHGTRVPSDPAAPAAQAAISSDPSPVAPQRSIAKRAVLALYRPLRPILRPIAWRMRSFLATELRTDIMQVHGELQDQREEIARLRGEFAEFAQTLEVTLLTLALGREDQ